MLSPKDVDDLVEIGELENYVNSTACMVFFLSRGYFQSRNCLREVRAALAQKKPCVLVHEADDSHGGLTIQAAKDECPRELREIIFTHCEYDMVGDVFQVRHPEAGSSIMPRVAAKARQVVTWCASTTLTPPPLTTSTSTYLTTSQPPAPLGCGSRTFSCCRCV